MLKVNENINTIITDTIAQPKIEQRMSSTINVWIGTHISQGKADVNSWRVAASVDMKFTISPDENS